MKLTRLLTLVAAFALLFNISCNSESEFTQELFYGNGYLISNEGAFPAPNADVTYISGDFSAKQDNIYSLSNNTSLGSVLQSVGFNGGAAYLVMNGSNKIQVVDRYTFKKYGEITEQIDNPRYSAFANNFLYVTNDKYGGDKYVSIYNAANNAFVKKISFTDNVERIVQAGGNIFVQNASFGFGNKISMINTSTNEVQSAITVPNGDITKTIAVNNNVYVIAQGTADSYIYQISSSGNIVNTKTLTGIANATNLEIYGDRYYFTAGKNVYAMSINATAAPTTPLFTVPNSVDQYSALYGFNVINGRIFTSDANGFSQDSKISVYSLTGSLLTSFTAGKGANGFYIN